MAKTFPIGHVRVNPNTYQTEMWDGSKWTTTTTGVPYTISGNGTAGTITTIGSSAITSSKPTISATERELIFEFLKENLRVAEYRDGNSKIESVELQLRPGPGYEWETVKREKIMRLRK